MSSDPTLRDLVRAYVGQAKQSGVRSAILATHAPELRFLLRELGADTRMATLTPFDIGAVLESPAIRIDDDDRPRTPFAVARIRHVIAEAIRFGVARGWIDRELLDVVAAYDHLHRNPGITWIGAES